jgi:hypothetical protein
MIDAPLPPTPPVLIGVEAAKDGTPLVLLGFLAFGSKDDLERLRKSAAAVGLDSERIPTDGQLREAGVMFPPGTDRAAALGLYHRARDGEFGPLKVEVVVVAQSAARDGIDFDREVSAVLPGAIVEEK